MQSIIKLLEDIEQLKSKAEEHSLKPEHIESLDKIADKLRGIKRREVLKDNAESTLTVITIIKMLVDWFGNSS